MRTTLSPAPWLGACVEIGDAVNAENDRLSVDHELLMPVLQRGLDDQG
jgi:hypothetical protein